MLSSLDVSIEATERMNHDSTVYARGPEPERRHPGWR